MIAEYLFLRRVGDLCNTAIYFWESTHCVLELGNLLDLVIWGDLHDLSQISMAQQIVFEFVYC